MKGDSIQQRLLNENQSNKSESGQKRENPFDLKIPKSYLDKMGVFEKSPLLNCFANEKEFRLKSSHLRIFYGLVIEADVLFNKENNTHLKTLSDLYRMTFNVEPESIEEVMDNQKWRVYGFQGNQPASDFRGGGFLALKTMKYIGEYEPELVSQVKEYSAKSDSFLFACIVITTIFELKNYFHFGVFSSYNEKWDEKKTCSRKQLKFFLEMDDCEHVEFAVKNLFKIAAAICQKMFLFWRKSCEQNPKIRIIDVKQAEEIIFRDFKKILDVESEKTKVPSYNLDKFLDLYLFVKIEDKINPCFGGALTA